MDLGPRCGLCGPDRRLPADPSMRPRRDPGRRAPLRLARDRKRRDRRGDRGAGPSPGRAFGLAGSGDRRGAVTKSMDRCGTPSAVPARTSPRPFPRHGPGTGTWTSTGRRVRASVRWACGPFMAAGTVLMESPIGSFPTAVTAPRGAWRASSGSASDREVGRAHAHTVSSSFSTRPSRVSGNA